MNFEEPDSCDDEKTNIYNSAGRNTCFNKKIHGKMTATANVNGYDFSLDKLLIDAQRHAMLQNGKQLEITFEV